MKIRRKQKSFLKTIFIEIVFLKDNTAKQSYMILKGKTKNMHNSS